MPFTVAGIRGVVLGQQEGTFEAWMLPVKLLSHFSIRAEVEGYPVPIELNDHARGDRSVSRSHGDYVFAYCIYGAADHVCAGWDGGWHGCGGAVSGGLDARRLI